MGDASLELIVYACPTGPLADQLDAYYARVRAEHGPNAAHRYPPHITLVGFFRDAPTALPIYVNAAAEALRAAPRPPSITITGAMFEPSFHGLLIESPWLKDLARAFAWLAQSAGRREALRLKDWLHLSLAYEFPPEQHVALATLGRAMVDVAAPVRWELRLYERSGADEWRCHYTSPCA
ncbi:MAG: hypothetical protein KatS3mg053_1732 [Candidatus Roseilinea sp.]|nr:MAG: hypothetical protein KatS3mg053_1732 [Candidatus Roseilinea sp.]